MGAAIMRRKHSIALGMSAVISIAYLILIAWYLYTVMHEHNSQADLLSLQAVAKELLPHLLMMAAATILTIVAFFSNIFAIALTAFVAYGIAMILAGTEFYQYVILCIPSILLAIIGSTFCYKRKQWLKEQEEERIYLATHPRPKVKRSSGSSYVNRMKNSGNYYRQSNNQGQNAAMMQNQTMPTQNYYGNQQDYYFQQNQQPLLPQQMYNPLQDPYAPLTPMQTAPNYMNPYVGTYNANAYNPGAYNNNMIQGSSSVTTNESSLVNPLYPINQQPLAMTQANPMISQTPMVGDVLNYPQPAGKPTRSEGYFDDYGNFHPGGNNF